MRIGDAFVAPIVLGAWLVSHGVRQTRGWSRVRHAMIVLALLAVMVRSVAVVGLLAPRLDNLSSGPDTLKVLTTTPPFDGWAAVGSRQYQIVRFVRACTDSSDPLLVLNHDYHLIGELPNTDGTRLRVFARNDRAAVSLDPDLGWPCFRSSTTEAQRITHVRTEHETSE